MKNLNPLFLAIIALSVTGISQISAHEKTNAQIESESESEHHSANGQSQSLKTIMQNLLTNSQMISKAIILEDFQMIEAAAEGIANHPPIDKDIVLKLKNGLGKQMGEFKQFDMQVHQNAVNIKNAAKNKEMPLIISEYHQLFNNCLACHSQFKERAIEIINH